MNPMREAANALLTGTGAFLRCDRGSALYVTNLPVKRADWPDVVPLLEAADFECCSGPNRLLLTPCQRWYPLFERWARSLTPPGALTVQLARRQNCPVCEEETLCWLEGVKRLDLSLRDFDRYDRLVRQTAAGDIGAG